MTTTMTHQQILDQSAYRTLLQGQKAYDNSNENCVFIDVTGKRCALGHLLPEGSTGDVAKVFYEIFPSLPNRLRDFLGVTDFGADLRNVHNNFEPCDWPEQFREVARNWHLDDSIISKALHDIAERSMQEVEEPVMAL